MLGFAVVLAISAVSMGIAYLGFERVSSGVATYRNSVSEADLARNIDRELISYRGAGALLCRDRQGRRRQGGAGGRSQPEGRHRPIDEGHHRSGAARPGHAAGREFQAFTKIFADILKVKSDSALLAQNQLRAQRQHAALQARRSPQQRRRCGASGDRVRRQEGDRQFQAVTALANTFVINSDQAVATSALARLKFVENSLHAITSKDEKIVAGLKEAPGCSRNTGRR